MYMLYSRAYQGHALLSVHNSKHVTLHVQTQSLALCINVSIYWSCCNNNVTADESVCNRPVYVDYWYGLADYGHIIQWFLTHCLTLCTHIPIHPHTHSHTHPLTHSSTHILIHPHTHTHPLTHSSTHILIHPHTFSSAWGRYAAYTPYSNSPSCYSEKKAWSHDMHE